MMMLRDANKRIEEDCVPLFLRGHLHMVISSFHTGGTAALSILLRTLALERCHRSKARSFGIVGVKDRLWPAVNSPHSPAHPMAAESLMLAAH